MLKVITIMFIGIGIGYLFRNIKLIQKSSKLISFVIFSLLFLLGIAVGANDTIVNNLSKLGGEAILIALLGTLGSILGAWLISQFILKQKK